MGIFKSLSKIIRKGRDFEGNGFRLKIKSAFSIEYSEPGHTMSIPTDIGVAPDGTTYPVVYLNQLRWDPPEEFLTVDETRTKQISDRVKIALSQLEPRVRYVEG